MDKVKFDRQREKGKKRKKKKIVPMNFIEQAFPCLRSSRVFTADYRDLAKIPAGKQPINPVGSVVDE